MLEKVAGIVQSREQRDRALHCGKGCGNVRSVEAFTMATAANDLLNKWTADEERHAVLQSVAQLGGILHVLVRKHCAQRLAVTGRLPTAPNQWPCPRTPARTRPTSADPQR